MAHAIKIKVNAVDPIAQYKSKLEISRKFGGDGLRTYALISKSADFKFLLQNAGVAEERLLKILAFMGRLGLITVEGLPKEFEEAGLDESALFSVAEADSLTRFRHQKLLFRHFSSDGIKVYELMRKGEAGLTEVSASTGIVSDKVREIAEFMLANDIAASRKAPSAEKELAAVDEKKEVSPKKEEKEIEAVKVEAKKEKLEPVKAEEEIKPREKDVEGEVPLHEEEAIAPVEAEGEEETGEPEEEIVQKEIELGPDEEKKIVPEAASRAEPEEIGIEEEAIAPVEAEGEEEAKELELEPEEGVAQKEIEEEAEPPEREKKAEPPEEEPAVEEEEVGEVRAEAAEMPETAKKPAISEEVEYKVVEKPLDERYRMQKSMLEKFGADGLKVYSLLTIKATKERVAELSGIGSAKVGEIINYMEREGFVELVGAAGAVRESKEAAVAREIEEEKMEMPISPEEDEEPEEEEIEIEAEEEMPEIEEEIEADEKGELTEFEQLIMDEFGEKGVEVYQLIDGKITAEAIMNKAGVDEDFIINLFEFLENRGIIRLERPKEKGAAEKPAAEKAGRKGGFVAQPISETIKRPRKEIIIRDMVPLDVPIMEKLSLPARMSLEAKLLAKFGSKALRLVSRIDNESDVVRLSIDNGIDLEELDEMLYSISNSGACVFATLSEDDIKRRYGEEALEIYRKYGRDGIIIYELIGKMDTLKKMVTFSKVDPRKAIRIIIEINQLLGIGDISEDDLKRELGI